MSNNIANPDASNLPYYVATYQGRSIAIKRDADYQNTIKLVQKSIPKLRSADVQDIFISTTLADFGDTLVQISEEIWPDLVSHIRTVEITLEGPVDGGEDVVPAQPAERVAAVVAAAEPINEHIHSQPTSLQTIQDSINTSIDPSDTFSITVRTASQELLTFSDLHPSSTIRDVKSLIETTYNVPAVLQRLDLLGQSLNNKKTLDQYDITDSTTLDLHLNARQSMIYFYPDPKLQTSERFRHKDIEVTLSLNRAWELATLRSSREVEPKDYVQSMSWTVDVAWGGLLEHSSIAERFCLFWDGISRLAQSITPDLPLTRSHPEPHPHGGSNLVPLLDPTNSVAVPFTEVEAYVQNVFCHMGFTESWLSLVHFVPHLKQKPHEYIALRFVSQADYDTMSSLSISPPAGHITRVLVLYKGLSAVAAQIWDIPQPRHAQGPKLWKSVVNIKPSYYWEDPGLKVLEISWMEVC